MTARQLAIVTLGYKAWRESRARFAISAVTLAALCVTFIAFQAELRRLMGATTAPANTYAGYVYLRIYATVSRGLFVLLAVVLALGGLARERAHGSLGFTLALPVRRTDHAIVRAAIGVLELTALAVIPAVLVPGCSALVGEHYPIVQALGFALLWIAGGSVMFAVSFAISVIIENDYAALAIAVLSVRLLPAMLARIPGLNRLPIQLHDLMSGRGMAYFDPARAELTSVPWAVVAGAAVVATCLLVAAVRITDRERTS